MKYLLAPIAALCMLVLYCVAWVACLIWNFKLPSFTPFRELRKDWKALNGPR